MGTSKKEANDWASLAREVVQVIGSKRLIPTMRTQYMRTAFQIPFDATVRISLDTNLCMISERGYNLENNKVWHRDPNLTIAHNQITRFPHAVLEIKLELKGENATPPKWVTDLQTSGMLYEVHKFSKFVHGCAVLLPQDVRSVPYWVDDISLRQSIIQSGGSNILVRDEDTYDGVGPGANQFYSHLLPFGSVRNDKRETARGRTAESYSSVPTGGVSNDHHDVGITTSLLHPVNGFNGGTNDHYGIHFYCDADEEEGERYQNDHGKCLSCFQHPTHHQQTVVTPTSVQKIEPKVIFANERTFLHWLHAGVTLYTISLGILVFSERTTDPYASSWAHWYAMALLLVALGFCMYALYTFLWRADQIKNRIPVGWHDPCGPLVLGGCLALVLMINFITKVYEIWHYEDVEL